MGTIAIKKAVCYNLSPALHSAATKIVSYVSASLSAKFLLANLLLKASFHQCDRFMWSIEEEFSFVIVSIHYRTIKITSMFPQGKYEEKRSGRGVEVNLFM